MARFTNFVKQYAHIMLVFVARDGDQVRFIRQTSLVGASLVMHARSAYWPKKGSARTRRRTPRGPAGQKKPKRPCGPNGQAVQSGQVTHSSWTGQLQGRRPLLMLAAGNYHDASGNHANSIARRGRGNDLHNQPRSKAELRGLIGQHLLDIGQRNESRTKLPRGAAIIENTWRESARAAASLNDTGQGVLEGRKAGRSGTGGQTKPHHSPATLGTNMRYGRSPILGQCLQG